MILRQRHGNRKMLYLFEQYKKVHPDEGDDLNPHVVAKWAIREGLWQRPPMDPEEILRRHLSRALRNEYMIDPQDREVRKYHPVVEEVRTPEGIKKRSKWYALYDAPPQHMRMSLSLRRSAALADVVQLKLDYESWNDNNKFGEVLPRLDFDFNRDIEEMNLPTDYPDEDPEEDEEGY